MKTVLDIAKEYFPNEDQKVLEFILWEYTGYPSFFDPQKGETVEDVLRKQLKTYKESIE